MAGLVVFHCKKKIIYRHQLSFSIFFHLQMQMGETLNSGSVFLPKDPGFRVPPFQFLPPGFAALPGIDNLIH